MLAWAWRGAEMKPMALVEQGGNILTLIADFFPPDITDWRMYVEEMIVTLHVAIWGTLLAVICAVPLGIMSSENIAPWWICQPVRRLMDAARAINEMVFAMMFVVAVGLGPFAGVLALWVHTTGTLAKLFSEAVEAIEVPEEQGAHAGSLPSDGAGSAGGADAADADGGADVAVADSPVAELPDQPVDYLLHTTEAGRAALDEFEPAKRFSELLAAEPDGYGDAYGRVLALCETGASKAAIEEALAGHPALSFPKRIYPGYFISKLETVDGISWDGAWRTTEAGQRMRALLA